MGVTKMGIRNAIKKLFEDNEHVTVYPTYGYRDGDDWKIPLRVWVHEPRKIIEAVIGQLVNNIGEIQDQERVNLETRMAYILADSESRERVIFTFDDDPEEEQWQVRSDDGNYSRSDLNGIVEGSMQLSDERARSLLRAQESNEGWLTFRAVSDEHNGSGRVRLLERHGVSVISDIDDTLKITEIPAGGKIVVINTFFRNFTVAPEMVNTYKNFKGASFHYVSGAPWQLFQPLSDFIVKEAFPEGSFHMKGVPTNLLSPGTWRDLARLTGDATVDQKLQQISEILIRFPERKFILVGDSGEHDPEIYRHLQTRFSDQVKKIIIRDVVNSRHLSSGRLRGMSVIPARTVREGDSEFDENH